MSLGPAEIDVELALALAPVAGDIAAYGPPTEDLMLLEAIPHGKAHAAAKHTQRLSSFHPFRG